MRVLALASVSLLAATGCAVPPSMEGSAPGPTAPAELPPVGYGTLRQDDVSISLVAGALQLKVTPLAESVTRVTAPDTYRRLSGLARVNRPAQATGSEPSLFLVSFFSDEPDVSFVPEDVQLVSQGLSVRPRVIMPITPTWGQHRLRQRETEMAVYFFPDVDLESDLLLLYGVEQSAAWSVILPRIQRERASARARAGMGSPQASNPYLEILR